MATIIDDGYLELTDGTDTLKLACEEIIVDMVLKPKMKHYEGGTNLGYDLGVNYFIFKVSGVILDSYTKFKNCISYLKSWQASAPFSLKIKRDTTNYTEWDGSNTTFKVLVKGGLKALEALSITQFEDVWYIGNITFEEAGSRS